MNDNNNVYIGDDGISPISDFYRGKTVLLTGVTGFLGECFLVKLLRTGVKDIYVLIRPRRNQSPQSRCEKMIETPIFEQLRAERPNFADHIIPICGSLDEIQLNITQEDQKNLFTNIEIIIHCAADIRFDVPIRAAVLRNVRGTRELLRFAQKMEKFENFVYISTAFAFCYRNVTCEQFYGVPIDAETMIKFAENTTSEKDRDVLDAISDKIISPWPNTYTFSKAMTENLVKKYRKYFKITIVRPSIVTASYREPIKGWNSNFSGLNGAAAGVTAGVLRTIVAKEDTANDIVCCDFVVNSALAAAYDVSIKSDEIIPIYNVVAGTDHSITLKYLLSVLMPYRSDGLPTTGLWYPFLIIASNEFQYVIYSLFLHIIPAVIVDMYLKTVGKKPKLLNTYRQIQQFSNVLNVFATSSFEFENSNMKRVVKNMTTMDKQLFTCDVSMLNWTEYKEIFYLYGIIKSLLKDNLDREKMRKHSIKLKVLHYGVCVLFGLCMAYFVFTIFKGLI